MKTNSQQGFTIIEVVLFLAITSLMIVGVIATSGSSVAQQRYKDSVYSLQSALQDQYSETLHTRNSITSNIACATDGSVQFDTGDKKRGQSENCVILGRYVTTNVSADKILSYPVVGYRNNLTLGVDDLSIFQKDYNMKKIDTLIDETGLEWGVSMQKANPITESTFTILILRSPSSGVIRTFVSDINNANIGETSLLNSSAMNKELLICLDSTGLLSGGRRMGIKIGAGASTSNAIETVGDGTVVADGGCS